MDRRQFLYGAGVLAAAASLPNNAEARRLLINKVRAGSGLSILQGLTTETATQLTVDVPVGISCLYTLTDVETNRTVNPDSCNPVTFPKSDTRVDRLKFSGLELGHKYQLLVKEAASGKVLDDRFLQTVDLNKKNSRFGIMSCMDDKKSSVDLVWPSVEAANLDYLFFIGDNVYGDSLFSHGPSLLWSRYVSTRANVSYYHWKNLKPVIAIWDDHDFGKNNEDGNYKYKNDSLFIFNTFFAQDPDGVNLIGGSTNYCYFRAFNQNFVFYDNRFYRSLTNPDGSKGFLGHEQIEWMNQAYRAMPGPAFVMMGSPMFGRASKGSTYEYLAPEELQHFLKVLKSWNTPIMFAGGDFHYSEVSMIDKSVLGYNSFELVSSCMHSSTKKAFFENNNQHLGGYLKENFLMIETDSTAQDLWKLTCVAEKTSRPFELSLSIS